MKTLVTITVKANKSEITTTTLLALGGKKVEGKVAHNDVVSYCLYNYVKPGDVLTVSVGVNRAKAADTFYAGIRSLESAYNVESQFINGEYIAMIKEPKLKVA